MGDSCLGVTGSLASTGIALIEAVDTTPARAMIFIDLSHFMLRRQAP